MGQSGTSWISSGECKPGVGKSDARPSSSHFRANKRTHKPDERSRQRWQAGLQAGEIRRCRLGRLRELGRRPDAAQGCVQERGRCSRLRPHCEVHSERAQRARRSRLKELGGSTFRAERPDGEAPMSRLSSLWK